MTEFVGKHQTEEHRWEVTSLTGKIAALFRV